MAKTFSPEDWGLETRENGELTLSGHSLVQLARVHGTPLHVVNAPRLRETARAFRDKAQAAYSGKVSVHYAMKCNSVPGVVALVHCAGLNVEVTTEYELQLARHIGFSPEQIIVNGPGKSVDFIRACLQANVRLVVVDALEELDAIESLAAPQGRIQDILLRVNPGYVPRGMNRGTATASRTGSAFGLDLKGGEVAEALAHLPCLSWVRFRGFHMHIGTGIRTPEAYHGALGSLPALRDLCRTAGERIQILDLGGGIGSNTTRGMTTREMALYETLGILPRQSPRYTMPGFESFFDGISRSVSDTFDHTALPELIFEPGRSITSQSQFLLLTVLGIKERPGIGTWVTMDGGLSTVSMPTYYECHELLLCNDVRRPLAEKVTLNGPACFAGDIIYKNKPMPSLHPGDVLALMDSGAYFTALESSFGFPRPAIISVDGASVEVVRARETFEDMISRDHFHDVLREQL